MMLFGGGCLSIGFLGIGTFPSVGFAFGVFYGCCFVLGFGVEVEIYLRFCFKVLFLVHNVFVLFQSFVWV